MKKYMIKQILPLSSIIAMRFFGLFLVLPVIGLYRHFGIIPALAFSFYFPLWYNALFDFHIDHLAIPILFGFFFLNEKESCHMQFP